MNDQDDQDQKWEEIERQEQSDALEQHELNAHDEHWN